MSDPQHSLDDELIDAALVMLDQAQLPASELLAPPGSGSLPATAAENHQIASEQSPTLSALDESRRPKVATVCERCPNSVWFASPEEVKCYCRVMFLVTWTSREPNVITHCDGQVLGQE